MLRAQIAGIVRFFVRLRLILALKPWIRAISTPEIVQYPRFVHRIGLFSHNARYRLDPAGSATPSSFSRALISLPKCDDMGKNT